MSFGQPVFLGLALLLPLLAGLAIWLYAARRRRVAESLGDPALVQRIAGLDLTRFPRGRLLLVAGAAAAIGVAAADPRWGTRVTEQQSSSLNIVFALDVSKSMLAEDVEPSRLEQERVLARRLLRDLPGDRLGLVAFAGRAYTLSPLTIDHGALNLYVDALDPEIVSQGGSSLAAALVQATDLARGSEESAGQRVVLLVSDGEALEDREQVIAAADRAARAGVTVFTVGVGTPAGATIPERDPVTGRVMDFKRDETGEIVVSRLDETLLREIADRSGGTFLRLDQAGATGRLVNALRGLERSAGPTGRVIEQQPRFALFVAIALLLILVDVVRQRVPPGTPLRLQLRPGRAVTAAVLALTVLSTSAYGPGDLERGNRLYREGRYAEAVEAYESALRSGTSTPQLFYNLGTALVRLGRYQEAETYLQRALTGVDPELRRRSFFNLGSRFLEAARGDAPAPGEELLENAIEAYKRALRLDPNDVDAKWNLELALREQEQQQQQQSDQPSEDQEQGQNPQPSGGGGQGGGDEGPMDAESQPGDDMSREQAERILSAVEQDERELTREKLQKGQRRTPVRRDW